MSHAQSSCRGRTLCKQLPSRARIHACHAQATQPLSRHHLPCRDPGLEMGSSPSVWSPPHFIFILPTVNHKKNSLFLQRLLEPGKLTKMYILYKKELIYNLFLITNFPNWVFYSDFYKTQNKADSGHFFVSKALDASHPRVYLQYLKWLFPRRGEQCPVVEFSYMGYSPPKCSCNCTPNIQVKHVCPYLNVYILWMRM